MKLEPVTKFDKRNTTTSKNIDNDVLSANFEVIVIFPIYGQFGGIWKPDSRCIACKTYISIKNNLLSYKLKTELKNLQHSCHTVALSKGTIFAQKNAEFCKKNSTLAKFRRSWY